MPASGAVRHDPLAAEPVGGSQYPFGFEQHCRAYLFAGSDAGGRRAAAIYSLIESAKLNGLNPQHYLADVLRRIAEKASKVSDR